ncbi:MAG: hypothetical protein ACPL7B_11070 [Candidatus Poribacteria bacterium]
MMNWRTDIVNRQSFGLCNDGMGYSYHMDKSLIISPNIGYKLFQNADLQVYSQIFSGDKADEYGPNRLGLDQAYYLKLIVRF